jgi:hypothetical protein
VDGYGLDDVKFYFRFESLLAGIIDRYHAKDDFKSDVLRKISSGIYKD